MSFAIASAVAIRSSGLDHLFDQAELKSPVGGESVIFALQGHSQRGTQRQSLGKPTFSTPPTIPTLTWVSRNGRRSRRDDVGVDDEMQTRTCDHSVHRAYRRFPHAVLPRGEEDLLTRAAHPDTDGPAFTDADEIRAGAEVFAASAGDQHTADVGVVGDPAPGVAKPGHHRGIQRVPALRPVQGDPGDMVADAEQDVIHVSRRRRSGRASR